VAKTSRSGYDQRPERFIFRVGLILKGDARMLCAAEQDIAAIGRALFPALDRLFKRCLPDRDILSCKLVGISTYHQALPHILSVRPYVRHMIMLGHILDECLRGCGDLRIDGKRW